jgi:hypothetical protein
MAKHKDEYSSLQIGNGACKIDLLTEQLVACTGQHSPKMLRGRGKSPAMGGPPSSQTSAQILLRFFFRTDSAEKSRKVTHKRSMTRGFHLSDFSVLEAEKLHREHAEHFKVIDGIIDICRKVETLDGLADERLMASHGFNYSASWGFLILLLTIFAFLYFRSISLFF